jgi:GcrA cell cycle regulator
MLGDPRWPPERDAMLKRLLASGCSAGEAAIQLGVTRNAVIGRAARMKLPLNSRRLAAPKAEKTPEHSHSRRFHHCIPPREIPPTSVTAAASCGLLELREGMCRWPLTEGARQIGWENARFCGASIEPEIASYGKPYCAAHCCMAYNRR